MHRLPRFKARDSAYPCRRVAAAVGIALSLQTGLCQAASAQKNYFRIQLRQTSSFSTPITVARILR